MIFVSSNKGPGQEWGGGGEGMVTGILIFMPHINLMPRTFSPSLTGSSNDVVAKNKMETKLHPISLQE